MPMQPRPRAETSGPAVPSLRYFTALTPYTQFVCQGTAMFSVTGNRLATPAPAMPGLPAVAHPPGHSLDRASAGDAGPGSSAAIHSWRFHREHRDCHPAARLVTRLPL